MRGTANRNLRILAGFWLALGVVALARALLGVAQFKIDPAGAADWADFSGIWGMLGFIHLVNGWALFRRHPRVRPLLAISSLVLGILYAGEMADAPSMTGSLPSAEGTPVKVTGQSAVPPWGLPPSYLRHGPRHVTAPNLVFPIR